MNIDKWVTDKEYYDLGNEFYLEKANKNMFSVYNTIYSDIDIEMWYDWSKRLEDTTWSNDCYWIKSKGEKIGGAIIKPNFMIFPFAISPFNDRYLIFKLLNNVLLSWSDKSETICIKGILPNDVDSFHRFGYRISRVRRLMIRPTDEFAIEWEEGLEVRTPVEEDAHEIATVFMESYMNGIDFETFGEPTLEECISDAVTNIKTYTETGSIDCSSIVYDHNTKQFIGACLAGSHPVIPNKFYCISDIGVKPAYRKKGIADNMIKRALNNARDHSPAIRLSVTIGNTAENLYYKLGFLPGVKFSNMYLQLKEDL